MCVHQEGRYIVKHRNVSLKIMETRQKSLAVRGNNILLYYTEHLTCTDAQKMRGTALPIQLPLCIPVYQ